MSLDTRFNLRPDPLVDPTYYLNLAGVDASRIKQIDARLKSYRSAGGKLSLEDLTDYLTGSTYDIRTKFLWAWNSWAEVARQAGYAGQDAPGGCLARGRPAVGAVNPVEVFPTWAPQSNVLDAVRVIRGGSLRPDLLFDGHWGDVWPAWRLNALRRTGEAPECSVAPPRRPGLVLKLAPVTREERQALQVLAAAAGGVGEDPISDRVRVAPDGAILAVRPHGRVAVSPGLVRALLGGTPEKP